MFTKNSTASGVEVLERCLPKIIISKTALRKMNIYIKECKEEIGWLGTVTKDKEYYYISDVMLFEQEVHATTTEITPEGLSKFGEELLQQENGIDIWNSIKVWGHSHVNMSVFASGQDDAQMETFAENGHDFFIRIIANKKGEMKLDLYDYMQGVIYTNLSWFENPTEVELGVTNQIAELESQVAELELQLEVINQKEIESLQGNIILEMKDKVVSKSAKTSYRVSNYNTLEAQTSMEEYEDYKNRYKDVGKKKDMEEDLADDIEGEIMVELEFCTTIYEVEGIFEQYGYAGCYTPKQMMAIWDIASGYGGAGYYEVN